MSKNDRKIYFDEDLAIKKLVNKYQNALLIIESANFGYAHFLYKPLRNALKKHSYINRNFFHSFIKTFTSFLKTPLTVHSDLHHSKILAAASYVNAVSLIRRLQKNIGFESVYLYDQSDSTINKHSNFVSRLILLSNLPMLFLLCFNLRKRLLNADFEMEELNEILKSFLIHKIYCFYARKILLKINPLCLLICNVNRPFELALWTEAKKMGIKTVFLPYNEIELHPARFLSLCCGDFDLALVFSEYSAKQMFLLNMHINMKVVGFPTVINRNTFFEKEKKEFEKPVVLYIVGNSTQESFCSSVLRECFESRNDLELKVRLHPNGTHSNEKFGWLDVKNISSYKTSSLEKDLASASAVITVNSTVSLDAILAGIPVIWITPPLMQARLSQHPYRVQKLSNLDACSSNKLATIIDQIFTSKHFYESEIKYQFARFRDAGYDRDWQEEVKFALEELLI